MNTARTLNAAIVAATLFGAAGFVLAQTQTLDDTPAARAADAAASAHGIAQAAASAAKAPEDS